MRSIILFPILIIGTHGSAQAEPQSTKVSTKVEQSQSPDFKEIDTVLGEWIPRPTLQRMLQSGIFTAREVLRINSLEKAKVKAEQLHREAINQLNRELSILSPHRDRLYKIRKNIDSVQSRLSKLNDNLFFYEVVGYQRVVDRMVKMAGGEAKKDLTARN